jgi:retron-type reverse transcriptase
MVVKLVIEPDLDAVFLADSYGYRPGKSALDAVGVTDSGAGNTTGFWNSTSRASGAMANRPCLAMRMT